jgi:hypothetical protein
MLHFTTAVDGADCNPFLAESEKEGGVSWGKSWTMFALLQG